jgi:PIN domain nuclease of toxin-antitoxin system
MKYLLDTCVLLWALEKNTKQLGDFVEKIIDPKSVVFVSMISYWEIAIKRSLGRLKIEGDLPELIAASGFEWLSIETRHIDYLLELPLLHHDPFDRLLIAQSAVDELELLTRDEHILRYDEFKSFQKI